MTTQRKLEIFLLAVALMLGVVFLQGWILERRARAQADATSQKQAEVIAAAQNSIAGRDKADALYAAALAQQSKSILTPQQAAQVIVHYLPAPAPIAGQPAPAPAVIPTVQRDELSPALQQSLPAAPSFSLLTPAQAEAVAKTELACDATTHTLAACQADAADLHTELTAQAAETAAWKAAAKGGTRFQRFVRVLKYTGCAAAGAGAGALAAHNSPAPAAAIGAGAGVTVCSLFGK